EIFSLLCRINDELGIAIIMIEQRVDWRLHNIDRILFMEKGSIVFNGNIHDFFFTGREEYLTPVLKMARYLRLNTFPKSLKDIRRAARDAAPKVRGRVEFESDTSQNSCIELQGIKVSLENNEILKGINLKIKSGEFVSVMGANGAGKTTLIKAICGLYRYEGSIKLGGSEVKKHKLKEIASKIGYVSQNPNDYISKETVYDEIKFTLDNFNITDENRIARVMDKLHLTELKDRNPRDLSGGEKQRTAIASVMVMLPEILILDEPTRGMDLVLKNELGLLLKEMNAEGKTIILVTHDMDFAAEFCTRHVLMFSGKIAAEGTIKEVMGDNLYYTTGINKIFRDINSDVFTLKQLERE
ncbi:MAG: ATP-binding cassette domain-containing protein, partial [Bacillota bacterium]|nr:ATP-binding cassette domain-containing protein [Bacillota bacterium]